MGDNLAAYASRASAERSAYFRDSAGRSLRRDTGAAAGGPQGHRRPDPAASPTPTDADLASHLHISDDQVREAQLAALAFQAASLDAPLSDSRGVMTAA